MRLKHLQESMAEISRMSHDGKYSDAILDYESILSTDTGDKKQVKRGDLVRFEGDIYTYHSVEKGIGGKAIFTLKDHRDCSHLAYAEHITIIERPRRQVRFSIKNFLI